MEDQENKPYHLTCLLSVFLNENQISESIGQIKKIIKENSGKIIKETPLSRKRLAYIIKKQNEAFYYALEVLLAPETTNPVQEKIKSEANIIRCTLDNKIDGAKFIPAPDAARTRKKDEIKISNQDIDAAIEKEINLIKISAPSTSSRSKDSSPKKNIESPITPSADNQSIEGKKDFDKKGRVGIEEIDKKLEEILGE